MISNDVFGVGMAGATSVWGNANAASAVHAAPTAARSVAGAKYRAAATDPSVNRGHT